MGSDNKKMKRTGIWLASLACIVLLISVLFFIFNNGSSTDELTITGSKSISGIRCADETHASILLAGSTPISHTNIITAAFMDKKLASISYNYEGRYNSAASADHARDLAEAAYNLTMTDKYGLVITDFTRNISVKDDTVYLSITSDSVKNLNSRTAAIFMLNNIQTFPTSLEDMKMAYEKTGFSCEVKNNEYK
ncbi:hypothetical protein IJJ36_01570 [Candidatus Saccharibacteria bacterium]|nr:hypothetical protein [Candidatus Saccharibacteria bacterium]MBQ6461104.1 hypothetical protein [Candidatus Saccharibacteria bacterium]